MNYTSTRIGSCATHATHGAMLPSTRGLPQLRVCITPFTPYSLMTGRSVLGQSTMSSRTLISFAVNALIIFSTIHAQDFRDEVGDKLMGRRTIPIVWPEGSRIWILAILTAWSVGLSWACNMAILFSAPFCFLSLFVGLRFFQKRTADADRQSYLYYNVRWSFGCKLRWNNWLKHFSFCRYGSRLPKSRISCISDRDRFFALSRFI